MPDEDGYSFMRQVRQGGASVPAVALTAYASDQDAERALLAGFQQHIIKPVEPDKLIGVVARLSEQSARRPV